MICRLLLRAIGGKTCAVIACTHDTHAQMAIQIRDQTDLEQEEVYC